MSRVTLVGLSKNETKKFADYFQTVGVTCDVLPNITTVMERLPADPPSLIVAQKPDQMEELQGLRAVLKTSAPATPLIVTIPKENAQEALEVMNAGAYDCLIQPYTRLSVLASAKRASLASGRTLFGARVKEDAKLWPPVFLGLFLFFVVFTTIKSRLEGPPAPALNLGSATLSGIEWQGRSLWVGNWMDATVTHYRLKKGFVEKQRTLTTDEIFRMQDSQPILVCNTPEAIVTVGFDLKLRSHQRGLGLPTLQTVAAPGPNPTGIAWDGSHLWSVDGQTGLLYKHGSDLRVIDSVRCLLPNPTGLAWDGSSFWVAGAAPMKLARYYKQGLGWTWQGPFAVSNMLPEEVPPAGMAVGFGRLWLVTGGAPQMVSRSLKEIMGALEGWKK